MDILSLKRRVLTFTLDCTDAFHQAPELDDVVVEPPEECEQLASAPASGGSCKSNCLVVAKLGSDGLITSQRPVEMEVHMDDVHGFGPYHKWRS